MYQQKLQSFGNKGFISGVPVIFIYIYSGIFVHYYSDKRASFAVGFTDLIKLLQNFKLQNRFFEIIEVMKTYTLFAEDAVFVNGRLLVYDRIQKSSSIPIAK